MPPPDTPQRLPVIDGATLRARVRAGERLWLVHAPGSQSFRVAHIRGAAAFADAAQVRRSLRCDDQIVVYGEDDCVECRTLAEDLLSHGYRRVWWYAGGLQEWVASGGEVEGIGTAADHSGTQAPRQADGASSEQGRHGKRRDT
jgi:3-mercaptopyruvate sulfurtransferase SseA